MCCGGTRVRAKRLVKRAVADIHVRNFGCGSGDREQEIDEGYSVGRRFADG